MSHLARLAGTEHGTIRVRGNLNAVVGQDVPIAGWCIRRALVCLGVPHVESHAIDDFRLLVQLQRTRLQVCAINARGASPWHHASSDLYER